MSKRDWDRIISEFKSSGMSQGAYAESRGVSLSSLTYHLKRSRGVDSFVRVGAIEKIELELAGGVVLRVSEENLRSVLKALQ